MACSTTDMAAWKRFSRLAANRKRFPMELAGDPGKDKLALFRQCMDAGENIQRVMEMKRTISRQKEGSLAIRRHHTMQDPTHNY